MKGGVGSASVRLDGGLVVGALAAVNAFGEVRNPWTREPIAGPRLDDGTLGDTVVLLPHVADRLRWGENTTLGIVVTNDRLTKPQANKVAQMAHDGLARAIYPVHTTVVGDIVFAAGTGETEVVPDLVGAWGARVMEDATTASFSGKAFSVACARGRFNSPRGHALSEQSDRTYSTTREA
jgi:L-aminopeptidase/D-esterase-like protein